MYKYYVNIIIIVNLTKIYYENCCLICVGVAL